LADRVLRVEHRILPEAIRLFAEQRVAIIDGQIVIRTSGDH